MCYDIVKLNISVCANKIHFFVKAITTCGSDKFGISIC